MATFPAFHLLGLCTCFARLCMFLFPMIVRDTVPSTTQFLLVPPYPSTYMMDTGSSTTANFTFLDFSTKSMNTPIPAGAVAYVKSGNQWKAKPGRVEVLF